MKKLLLITAVLLLSGNAFSQIEIEKISDLSIDQMLEDVDKTKFTSGMLIERSQNYSNIDKFNIQKESIPINYSYFKQALLDLYNASNKTLFVSSKTLKDGIKNSKVEDHIVDFGIISSDFESLNYNSKDERSGGLKLKNGKFKQLENKDAFISHTALVVSPLKIAAKGSVITYRFNNQYWFNNSARSIQSLTLQFENGNAHQIIREGEIVLKELQQNYNETGDKIIQFEAVYEDGKKINTHSKIHIIVGDMAYRMTGAIENGHVLADPPEAFQGYDESSSVRGRIDYRIYFRTNNGNNSQTLLKPIIIIDGFDPQNKRRIEDVDCANDPTCVSLFNGNFSNTNHRSIFDLMQPTDGSQNLVDRLRGLGYDVIIVNHPTYMSGGMSIDGGADFIERNGLTLTRLIRNVNTRVAANGSNEELVIVGPSMGGQISRYALSYMEKKYQQTNQNQWLHNTRLWISVDSPHLGANIPLGVQALINQAKDHSDAAQDFADNQLGSPAAKQQLIEQYNGTSASHLDARTVSQGYSYSRGAPFFQEFYNNLFNNGLTGSKGYPQNLRKIALVNGSMTGSRGYENPFTGNDNDSYSNDSELTVNMRAFQRLDIIPFTNFTVHVASIETYFLPGTGGYGKISRFKKTFADESIYMTNGNSRGNMDNVSGGWFPAQYDLASPILPTNPANAPESFWNSFGDAWLNVIEYFSNFFGGSYWELRDLKHANSFIASFSAIGYLSPDTNWAQALDKNLVCQSLTPFDSYFGHDKNTQHTSFNTESVAWLLAELDGDELDPYFPVNSNNLVGPTYICQNNNTTYTFNSCSTPGTVQNWTVSSNLTIIGSDEDSIIVNAPLNTRSAGWIRADFNNGVSMQKDVWIGTPFYPNYPSMSGDDNVIVGQYRSYSVPQAEGETSYQWYFDYGTFDDSTTTTPWEILYGQGTTNINVKVGNRANTVVVVCRASNSCGSTIKYMYVTVNSSGGGGGSGDGDDPCDDAKRKGIRSYPNPIKNGEDFSLVVYPDDDCDDNYIPTKIQAVGNYEIKIFDLRGFLVYSKKHNTNVVRLTNLNLLKGLYLINVIDSKGSVERKTIVVQ